MESPLSNFDKIYVISAKDNIERRSYITDIFSHFNVDFEFVDAVMGKDLSEKELREVYNEKKARKHKTIKRALSKPEIGCSLSHKKIYKKIIQLDLENALIFEDDIKPVYKNIEKNLFDAFNELPKNWELFTLGTLDDKKLKLISYKIKLLTYYPIVLSLFPNKLNYNYRELKRIYPRNYSKSLRYTGYHMGNHSYAISKEGAKKVLDYTERVFTPHDCLISLMIIEGKLNAYMTKKKMFDQNEEMQSSIEKSRLSVKGHLE